MTAHLYWERVWRGSDGSSEWLRPDPWVLATLPVLHARGVRSTLDLGCGLGRHTLLFARDGFDSHGIDRSLAGAAAAREGGLAVSVGDMAALPYRSASFDFVLAFNVNYHTDERGLGRVLAEVRRVLRPGGLYQATMLSKRHREYGRGVEVSPNTFCQPDAPDDKVHPHLYTDAADLIRLHAGFDLVAAVDGEQSAPGSFHWQCQFEAS
jgi:SAM-dependent methyltransferase